MFVFTDVLASSSDVIVVLINLFLPTSLLRSLFADVSLQSHICCRMPRYKGLQRVTAHPHLGFIPTLKADRLHLQNYLHVPPDYRHTDKNYRNPKN